MKKGREKRPGWWGEEEKADTKVQNRGTKGKDLEKNKRRRQKIKIKKIIKKNKNGRQMCGGG